jgi:tetratricopeptide (TPR) repeat protein
MGRTQQACDAYRGELALALRSNLEAHAEVLSLLRPFFLHDWTSPSASLLDEDITFLATDVANALSGVDEPGQALAVYGMALDINLKLRDWTNVRIDLTNLAAVLDELNRLAASERCVALALELAELINDPADVFMARLATFGRFSEAGRVADAEHIWRLLDSMGRSWPRNLYRPGEAESRYAWFQLDQGTLTEEHLARAERLARSGRNHRRVRSMHAVRGQWLLQQDEWSRAADSFTEAVRMAREAGIADLWSETHLALACFRLGQLPEPIQEAERLAAVREPAHLPMAELWQAIGHTERATEHALAAYCYAWADGEPYVRRAELERAAHLLRTLGARIPVLPAYDPTTDPEFPCEDKVMVAVKKLRGGREPAS